MDRCEQASTLIDLWEWGGRFNKCNGDVAANDSALGSNIPEWVALFRLGLVGLCTDFEQHMVGQVGCVAIKVFLNVIGGNDDPCGSISRCDCQESLSVILILRRLV